MYFFPPHGWAGTNNSNGTLVRLTDLGFDPDPLKNEVIFSPNQNAPVVSATPKGSQYLFQLAFGGAGTQPGEIDYPTSIAINSTDQTHVACDVHTSGENGRIEVFDKNGNYVKTIGKNDLWIPYAIAFDSNDNVFVTEVTKNKVGRVARFSSGGVYTTQMGVGALSERPSGLAVDDLGNVYVADKINEVVFKLSANGTTARLILSGSWSFQNPEDIVFDKTSKRLYVSDSGANAIFVFLNDQHIDTWDYQKNSLASKELGNVDVNGNGIASSPYNLAVDGSGNLIGNFHSLGLFKFDNTGKLIPTSIPSKITPLGKLEFPTSLAFDSNDQLYALDRGYALSCVKVYSPTDYVELLVHVPPGAKTGIIKVNVNGATLTSDGSFVVWEIPPPTNDLYLPKVGTIELTQGLVTYPFIVSKETLLWASISGHFGDPNRDKITIKIKPPYGKTENQTTNEFVDDSKKGFIAKYYVPTNLINSSGKYIFEVEFTRDHQRLPGNGFWSKSATLYDVKIPNILFVKLTDVPTNLWGQQEPYPYFNTDAFLHGIITTRRTFPLAKLNYTFYPGMYSSCLPGGLQDSDQNTIIVEVKKILNTYRNNGKALCVVGLVDPTLNQIQNVPCLGWAWSESIITFFTSGVGFYNWGSTLAHEIGHICGLVPTSQPNYINSNGGHSKNEGLDKEEGAPVTAWNSVEDKFYEDPYVGSMMCYKNVTDDNNSFFESRTTKGEDLDYQWLFNKFHIVPTLIGGGCAYLVMPSNEDSSEKNRRTLQEEKLVILGTIKDKRNVSIAQSFLTKEDFPLTPDADSEYEIAFIDHENTTIAQHGFSFTPIQDGGETEKATDKIFSLVKPFPQGTVKVEIRYESTTLTTMVYSHKAPEVTNISVELHESSYSHISWKASDEKENPLQFNVLYSSDNGRTFQPIGVGLSETKYVWDHSMTPGSDKAVIKVTASNGLREGSALSTQFKLPKKKPIVAIVSPAKGATFKEGESITLHGLGHDPEDGELEDQSLVWYIDGVKMDTGRLLRVKGVPQETAEGPTVAPISVGPHTVTLLATDSDKNRATSQIHINVIPESKETKKPNNS